MIGSKGSVREKLKQLGGNQGVEGIDWLMGHDFGEIKIGRKNGVAIEIFLRNRLRLLSAKASGGGGGGGSSISGGRKTNLSNKILSKNNGNSALVKLIPDGSTTSARGMKAQLNYLDRDETTEVIRSDSFFNAVISEDEIEELVDSWGMNEPNPTGVARTSHFVVSFPIGTDREAADKAAKGWASELFDSGKYGDVYDYYLVTHRDTDHPHTHVVVNRRGLENDSWLKISKRGLIDYTTLREVQVDAAAKEGIELNSIPRAARGEHELAYTSTEVQKAKRENRQPIRKQHNEASALITASKVLYYVNIMQVENEILRDKFPELGKSIDFLSNQLKEGHSLVETQNNFKLTELNSEEYVKVAETLDQHRDSVIEQFKTLDEAIQTIPNGAQRVAIEREINDNKIRLAPFLGNSNDNTIDTTPDKNNRFKGVFANDDIGNEYKLEADNEVRTIAQSRGLNPEATIARYNSPSAATTEQADRWERQEREEISSSGGEPNSIGAVHDDIRTVYARARQRLLVHSDNKRSIVRSGREIEEIQDDGNNTNLRESLGEQQKERISRSLSNTQIEKLERGDATQLSGVTNNPVFQGVLAKQYLDAAINSADENERTSLQSARNNVERFTEQQIQVRTQQEAQQSQELAVRNQNQTRSRNDGLSL